MREALPKASFIGFTGTPIELTDKNTRAVFGNYISIYDIERAVKDGATVAIYYASRLARLALNEAERPKLDEEAYAPEEASPAGLAQPRKRELPGITSATLQPPLCVGLTLGGEVVKGRRIPGARTNK